MADRGLTAARSVRRRTILSPEPPGCSLKDQQAAAASCCGSQVLGNPCLGGKRPLRASPACTQTIHAAVTLQEQRLCPPASRCACCRLLFKPLIFWWQARSSSDTPLTCSRNSMWSGSLTGQLSAGRHAAPLKDLQQRFALCLAAPLLCSRGPSVQQRTAPEDKPLACSRRLQNHQSRQACQCSAAFCSATARGRLSSDVLASSCKAQHSSAVGRQAAAAEASSLQRSLFTSYEALQAEVCLKLCSPSSQGADKSSWSWFRQLPH